MERHRTRRILIAVLAAVLLLAAGAAYTWPRMTLTGPSGYTVEGVADFNAGCQTGEPCLLGSVNIWWNNRGPLEWTLPYTIENITVCDMDGHPLEEQPDSLVYDLTTTNVWPGAGIYEDRQALLAEYAAADLKELPAAFPALADASAALAAASFSAANSASILSASIRANKGSGAPTVNSSASPNTRAS